MAFNTKTLVAFATAIASVNSNELFNRDGLVGWVQQGQCYVTSTIYTLSRLSTSSYAVTSAGSSSAVTSAGSSSAVTPAGSSTAVARTSSVVPSSSVSQTFSNSASSQSTSSTFASCPLQGEVSCSNTTFVDDLCCYEYPGGVVLLAQFWDYAPTTGPLNEFTIHGLWPDNCDGSYGQYCDTSLEITNPGEIVKQFDEGLYEEMTQIWKDYTGDDESLWYHEYNKHGTCYSTLKPQCFGQSTVDPNNREDVYDFYKITVDLHKQLPTYDWLAAEGITPSLNSTYSLSQIQNALTKHYGYLPYIGCDSNNSISEIWYYNHVRGSLRQEDFVKIDTLAKTKCPATGVKYYPKNPSNTPTPVAPGSGPTIVSSLTGNVVLSGQTGCLAKDGQWTTSSCDTFTFSQLSTGSYYLRSSTGNCGLEGNLLQCGSSVAVPYEFNYDSNSGFITSGGSAKFSASSAPFGSSEAQVSAGSGSVVFNLKVKSN